MSQQIVYTLDLISAVDTNMPAPSSNYNIAIAPYGQMGTQPLADITYCELSPVQGTRVLSVILNPSDATGIGIVNLRFRMHNKITGDNLTNSSLPADQLIDAEIKDMSIAALSGQTSTRQVGYTTTNSAFVFQSTATYVSIPGPTTPPFPKTDYLFNFSIMFFTVSDSNIPNPVSRYDYHYDIVDGLGIVQASANYSWDAFYGTTLLTMVNQRISAIDARQFRFISKLWDKNTGLPVDNTSLPDPFALNDWLDFMSGQTYNSSTQSYEASLQLRGYNVGTWISTVQLFVTMDMVLSRAGASEGDAETVLEKQQQGEEMETIEITADTILYNKLPDYAYGKINTIKNLFSWPPIAYAAPPQEAEIGNINTWSSLVSWPAIFSEPVKTAYTPYYDAENLVNMPAGDYNQDMYRIEMIKSLIGEFFKSSGDKIVDPYFDNSWGGHRQIVVPVPDGELGEKYIKDLQELFGTGPYHDSDFHSDIMELSPAVILQKYGKRAERMGFKPLVKMEKIVLTAEQLIERENERQQIVDILPLTGKASLFLHQIMSNPPSLEAVREAKRLYGEIGEDPTDLITNIISMGTMSTKAISAGALVHLNMRGLIPNQNNPLNAVIRAVQAVVGYQNFINASQVVQRIPGVHSLFSGLNNISLYSKQLVFAGMMLSYAWNFTQMSLQFSIDRYAYTDADSYAGGTYSNSNNTSLNFFPAFRAQKEDLLRLAVAFAVPIDASERELRDSVKGMAYRKVNRGVIQDMRGDRSSSLAFRNRQKKAEEEEAHKILVKIANDRSKKRNIKRFAGNKYFSLDSPVSDTLHRNEIQNDNYVEGPIKRPRYL